MVLWHLTAPKIEIHIGNLKKNYRKLRELAGGAVAAAVVKNDAYGLGAALVAEALYQEGCRDFFVAHGIEGGAVRAVARDAHIYVLQGMGEDSRHFFEKFKLTPVISTWAEWEYWKAHRIVGIKPVVQVETGLNRLGLHADDVKKLSAAERDEFSIVMSHLACADDKAHFMNEVQLKAFKKMRAEFPKAQASLSASDGVFLGKEFLFDMVRLGAAMYGINTAPYRENQMAPVLFMSAPVLEIGTLKAGDYVGYGATYRASGAMRIAVVSIGYGDGFVRALGGRGKVFFKGKAASVIGRVSMDNIMVDVTDIPELGEGEMVEVLNAAYTVDDMGRDAGTIGYEVLNWVGKGARAARCVKE